MSLGRKVYVELKRMLRTEARGHSRVTYCSKDGPPARQVLRSITSYTRYAYLAANFEDSPDSVEYVGPQVMTMPTVYVDAKVLGLNAIERQYPHKVDSVRELQGRGLHEAMVSRGGDVLAITSQHIPGDRMGHPLKGYAYHPTWSAEPAAAPLIVALREVPRLTRDVTRMWETSELWLNGTQRIMALPPDAFEPTVPIPDDVVCYMEHHDAHMTVDGVEFRHLTGYENGPYFVFPRTYRLETLERAGDEKLATTVETMKQNGLEWAYLDALSGAILPAYDANDIVDRMGEPVDPSSLEAKSLDETARSLG